MTGGEDAMLCLWSAQQLSSMSPSDGRKSKVSYQDDGWDVVFPGETSGRSWWSGG